MSCPGDEVTLWTEGRKVVRTVGLLHFQNASSLSAELSIVDGFRESYATSIHDDDMKQIETIYLFIPSRNSIKSLGTYCRKSWVGRRS